MSVEPGKYVGKVANFGVGKSKGKGTPFLDFKLKLNDSGLDVYWQAWLTPKTIGFVLENLMDCNLLNTRKLSTLAQGPAGNGINLDQDVEIVVASESYTGNDGELKTISKVQSVYPLGGGAMKNSLAENEGVAILDGLNLDAELLAIEQRTGKKVVPTNLAHTPQTASMDSEHVPNDVPF